MSEDRENSPSIEGQDDSPTVQINIRTVDGNTYEYEVNRYEQVQTLIDLLKERIQVPENHTIRLIYSGRILQPTDTFAQHRITSGAFIHAQVSEVRQSRRDRNRRNRRARRQAAAREATAQGTTGHEGEDDEPLSGFDRLSQFGFSGQEIDRIRLHFHAFNPESQQLRMEHLDNPNELAARLRESEDIWLQRALEGGRLSAEAEAMRRGVQSGGEQPGAGTTTDLILGFVTGFGFGLLSIFLINEGTRRQKVGILAGLGINTSLSILTYLAT